MHSPDEKDPAKKEKDKGQPGRGFDKGGQKKETEKGSEEGMGEGQ